MLKEKFLNQNYEFDFTDEDFKYFNLVRDNFLSEMVDKIDDLECTFDQILENEFKDEEALYSCNRIAHTIKGSGYSFGFRFFSEIAFCIEEITDVLQKNKEQDINIKMVFFDFIRSFNDIMRESVQYFMSNVKKFEINEDYYKKLYEIIDKFDFCYEKLSKKTADVQVKKISEVANKKFNVLFCENNKILFKRLEKMLCKKDVEFNIVYTTTLEDAIREMQKNEIDIIFCTFYLKNFTALSFYQAIQYSQSYNNIPFYFLCTDIHDKLLENGIENKYIIKKDVQYLYSICNVILKLAVE